MIEEGRSKLSKGCLNAMSSTQALSCTDNIYSSSDAKIGRLPTDHFETNERNVVPSVNKANAVLQQSTIKRTFGRQPPKHGT